MLKRLTLKDFQRHEEIRIEFDPLVTTIRGPTDSGKSAILRALRWICLNDFAGEEFIREGSETVLVSLRVDGAKIGRGKGKVKGSNVYSMGEEEFRAFGQGVPDPIAKVLHLSPLNFQGQHDSPFWFKESAGEVSRQLNSVIDLSVIDTSLANIARVERRSQERVQLTSERLEKARLDLDQLDGMRERVESFQDLKKSDVLALQARQKYEGLSSYLLQVDRLATSRKREKAEEGATLLLEARKVLGLGRRISSLQEILEQIQSWQSKASPPPDFGPVGTAYYRAADLVKRHDELRSLVRRIQEAELVLSKRLDDHQEKEREFHRKIRGNICPLCNQTIK